MRGPVVPGHPMNSERDEIPVENAVNASTAGGSGQIVVAGAGYAGLHVALRLTSKLRKNSAVELILVDRHEYHQAITELPRVAAGIRAADAVRIPLQDTLSERVGFVQAEINGFDLAGRRLLTGPGRSAGGGWYWRWAADPTTSTSLAWPSARSRFTPPPTPSGCGRRSAKRLRLPQPPTPGSGAAWRPW